MFGIPYIRRVTCKRVAQGVVVVAAWQEHWLQSMVALDGRVLQRVAGMTIVLNPHLEGPAQNFALWHTVGEQPAAQLQAAAEFLAALGRTPAFWLTPDVAPIVEPLLARTCTETCYTIRWRDLTDLPSYDFPEAVQRCTDADLPTWAATLVEAFGWSSLWQGGLVAAYKAAAAAGGRGYLLRQGTEPVGCGWLQCTGEVAGLYAGGVLPEARGRGYGRALVLQRLHDARMAGAQQATMQVLPGSAMDHLAAALGFEAVAEARIWQHS